MTKKLRVVFTVQGEGRGHLSQALALREMLEGRGHEVVGLLVGQSRERPLPAYFRQRMHPLVPVVFPSPTTVPGRHRTGVSPVATVRTNLIRLPSYVAALKRIRSEVHRLAPDLVINFYDAVAGVALARGKTPFVAIGHQYLLGHCDAPRPPFRPAQLLMFRIFNRLSAPGATPRLALSFRPLSDGPDARTLVVPPLLRSRILNAVPESGAHLLVYVVNDGYGEAIRQWHVTQTDVTIHGFWDRQGAPEREEVQPGLTFHQLNDESFLETLRTCRGFIGTAGFESVAEAMWLDKAVFVVPTGNQVEQAWNAREAEVAGAGISGTKFDLDPFIRYLPQHVSVGDPYRAWVREGSDRTLDALEKVAERTSPPLSA
jgi:uncharacterized protein (TIGR00661 family)